MMCSASANEKNSKSPESKDVDEDAKYRIYSIISYFIVLVVIGLPVWWYTTRVYRASLPISRMYEVELKSTSDKDFGIPLSLEYDILLSFVHPDPGVLEINLKGEDIDSNLKPFLNSIGPIADFVVKSQWLYQTELGAEPRRILDHNVLLEKQLPHIITPLETKLWSHLSSRPSLNLVLYFSRCDLPLHIYDNDYKLVKSNAFVSPRWGGIYIVNPDMDSCESNRFKPDLQIIVSTFITQLRHLFKIDNSSNSDDIHELKMRKAHEMLDSTHRTLRSLAQLLSEINSIVISDEVGEKINVAVENADLSESFLKEGLVEEGLKHAKIAFSNSEAAFSDPSLLALLYFPEDQKYAVYIPLFLPIMIPVFMSLTIVKKWMKARKEKAE